MENIYVSKEVFDATLQRFADEDSRQNHRISQVETGLMKLNELLTTIEKLAVNMENMAKEQHTQGERLSKLESKGGKIWDHIVECTISCIVSGLIVYLLCKLGLKG